MLPSTTPLTTEEIYVWTDLTWRWAYEYCSTTDAWKGDDFARLQCPDSEEDVDAFIERKMFSPGMDRTDLIGQLADYARRHPTEKEAVGRFVDFVRRNPDCFDRDLAEGHVTGSAWIVSAAGTHALLTHHRKLDRWLQLGGHSDGNPNTLQVAIKEAMEESGLFVQPLSRKIFDLDIHTFANGDGPSHIHFDVRYLLGVEGSEEYTVSEESVDLAWVKIDEIESFVSDPSVTRMAKRWQQIVKQRAPTTELCEGLSP